MPLPTGTLHLGMSSVPLAAPASMTSLDEHRRSVGFLEHEGETWSCFLVTYPARGSRWHGYFSFRAGDVDEDEVRTADIFLEDSEAEIHAKARGLGRPLLNGLLSSALHTAARGDAGASRLRRRFRTLLAENAREISGAWVEGEPAAPLPPEPSELDEETRARLRSMYASYRLDQVAHFICLVDPPDFEEAVDAILDGQAIDFRARDRVQFAMMVVEHIESRLPLPPFRVWARDYLDHPETYRLYAHTLHREGRLP